MQFKSLVQCLDYFKDEQTCIDYLIQQRWNGNTECPSWGCAKVYKIEILVVLPPDKFFNYHEKNKVQKMWRGIQKEVYLVSTRI